MTGDIFAQYAADLGYEEVKGCDCANIRREMNENGPQWCLDNVDSLATRVARNYAKRGLVQRIGAVFAKPYIKGLLLSAINEAMDRDE